MPDHSRILLVTGKGGVGKTTVAAATAARCASLGLSTLLVSTDVAHSIADVLDVEVGDRPVEVSDRLTARQIDGRAVMGRAWADVRAVVGQFMDRAGVDGVRAEELAVPPGVEEVLALGEIADHADDPAHDVIVIDCAPSAETIRLLAAPEILTFWARRLRPDMSTLLGGMAPLVEQLLGVEVPTLAAVERGEAVVERVERARRVLCDVTRTSARLVVVPERLVVAEASRTLTYLHLFGHEVDAVIVNRVLPSELTDPWWDRWREIQARELARIDEGFAPLPRLRVPLRRDEPIGVGALAALGDVLYAHDDPTARLHVGAPMRVEAVGEGERDLVVTLPGVDGGAVEVGRRRGELFVGIGPYRRSISLPDSLAARAVRSAVVDGGELRVRFGSPS